MAKPVTITEMCFGEYDYAYVMIDLSKLRKICSVAKIDDEVVVGRYGTNKTTLRKILKRKILKSGAKKRK